MKARRVLAVIGQDDQLVSLTILPKQFDDVTQVGEGERLLDAVIIPLTAAKRMLEARDWDDLMAVNAYDGVVDDLGFDELLKDQPPTTKG